MNIGKEALNSTNSDFLGFLGKSMSFEVFSENKEEKSENKKKNIKSFKLQLGFKEYSELFKQRRLSVGLSQEQVAKKAKISPKVVGAIESDCSKVSFSSVYKYLKVFSPFLEEEFFSLFKPFSSVVHGLTQKGTPRKRARQVVNKDK